MLTVQALSEDDYRFWLQAMGGKEPVSYPLHSSCVANSKIARALFCNVALDSCVFETRKSLRDVVFPDRSATPWRGLTPKREEVRDLAALQNSTRQNHHVSWFGGYSTFMFLLLTSAVDAQLDDVGLSFLKNSINAIETRGELRLNDIIGPQVAVFSGLVFFHREVVCVSVFFNTLVHIQQYLNLNSRAGKARVLKVS